MKIFYLELIIILIVATIGDLIEKEKRKTSNLIITALIIILALVAGLRWGIGDTGAYVQLYNNILPGVELNGYEPGFVMFLRVLKSFNRDPQFMIFVTAVITTILNLKTIKIYSESFTISAYLYITSGYYIVTMNGIRQSLVAAVIFASTKLIEKNKFLPYLIICLIMSTFHFSALMMIPVYYVVRKKSWSKELYIMIGLAILILFAYPYVENLIFSLLGKYGDYKDFNEGGANILRIAVAGVPVILAYTKRDYIKENWKAGNIFVNMSLLNFMIMCFSYYNWIFARFNIYTQPYTFVLLTYLAKNCFEKKERRIIIYALLILYFVFFWYDNSFIMGLQYRSNFINI